MQDQIDKLKQLNGELCAEVNALTRAHVGDVERIDALESLVRDIWTAYSRKSDESFHPAWDVDESLELRIAALGMEVNG